MRIAKEVREGEMIPKWYGIAWLEWQSMIAICYPIPLNLLIRIMRSIVTWMRAGHISVALDPREAYLQGLRDGQAWKYQPGKYMDPGMLRDFEEAEKIGRDLLNK